MGITAKDNPKYNSAKLDFPLTTDNHANRKDRGQHRMPDKSDTYQ